MTPSFREFFAEFRTWRLLLLVAIIIGLTFVHQIGGVHSSPFRQLLDVAPYLPILLGALWFGFPGAMTCAFLTSACYITHMYIHEGGGLLDRNLHKTLNILMFNVVAAVTGLLAQRQLRTMAGYRQLAAELKASYAELQKKTEELFCAEEYLQRANRLAVMGELTGGLAHEIGNPLGGIKGAAEILADGIGAGDKKRRFADILLREVTRLDSVVRRFLDSVRCQETEESRADLQDVLQSVVALCEQSLRGGGLELHLDIDDATPLVAGDPHQLHQVFLNLLLNAIQSTPEGGRITLRARRVGDAVECEVADTGCGIEPENLTRLFDPFFTTRNDGTGLGLAITHRIIEGCGGRIRVHSRPGEGATFTVTLPASEEAPCLREKR